MKKRAKIIGGVILTIFDIAICFAVGDVWLEVGCSGWSFFAAIIFYTVGSLAFWVTYSDTVDWYYENKKSIELWKKAMKNSVKKSCAKLLVR